MKKHLILPVILALCMSLPVVAQVRFGIKGGVNISQLTFNNSLFNSNNVTGFQVGPTLECMCRFIGFDASVLYSQKGMNATINTVGSQVNSNTGYIDIPVNLKFRINALTIIKPFFAIGPSINFKLSGDNTINQNSDGIVNQWKTQTFGVGANIGAGIELIKRIQIGINYHYSLSDDYKASNGDYSAKDRTLSITAAVFF